MTGQPSLFDEPLSDPDVSTPGAVHRHAHDTERAAARRVMPRTGTQRRRVLEAIAAAPRGLTDEELELLLNLRRPSPGNRRGELVTGGWVYDSGRRRPTRSGNPAIVWKITVAGRAELKAMADA